MLHYSKIDTERADAPFIETVHGNNALHKFVDITKKYRDIAGMWIFLAFLANNAGQIL